MASWMIHLRMADKLLSQIPGLSELEFIMGSIAPDSGVPNADWSAFSPSTDLSHFKDPQIKHGKGISIPKFLEEHFTPQQQKRYNQGEYAFFLGYLTHLLTDIFWADEIFQPAIRRFPARTQEAIALIKKDWYDLDFLYLRQHPDFHAFHVFRNAAGFRNTYMDIFSADAFDDRRAYITGFYMGPREDLDRPYPYLTAEQADRFIEDTAGRILKDLTEYCIDGQ